MEWLLTGEEEVLVDDRLLQLGQGRGQPLDATGLASVLRSTAQLAAAGHLQAQAPRASLKKQFHRDREWSSASEWCLCQAE